MPISPSARARRLAPVLVAGALAAAAPAACAGDPADDFATVRDSAGVEIVESSAPRLASDATWRVDTAPLLDLPAGGGAAPEFVYVADAVRLGDGSIVLADAGAHEVRRYGPDGALRWRIGRDGAGPGEFRQLANVVRIRGDSVVAFDLWLGRATVVGPDGGVGREFYPFGPKPAIERLRALDDTMLVAQVAAYDRMEGSAGLFRVPASVVAITATGAVVDTLASLLGDEIFLHAGGDSRPILARRGHVAAGGGRLYVGDAARMEFAVHAPTGELERIVRVPTYDLDVAPLEIERERTLMLGPRPDARRRAVLDQIPDPTTRPAYGQLVVDATGAVWAAAFRAFADTLGPTTWELFDRDGAWLGATELPRTLRVLEIGDDWMLAVHPDELDVDRVQVLPVRRAAP